MASGSTRKAGFLPIILALVFFGGVPILASLATLWTDYLWYVDLGQRDVFLTRITSQWAVPAASSARRPSRSCS